ncbi:hypothetical protein [Rhizobium lentis]|uniref:hypothetical protein n=1 Tax=Rhizobium lentis TaxID=1138194 RepID=UPI001C82CE93|nr:hypothetical protein [Rhizobium lentis]MBX4989568.1 hypothetical protein [Rhizobium lentis]
MPDNLWDTEHGAMFGANAFATLNALYLLIDKGLISKEDAARVMTQTATQVRDASEDGTNPQVGEELARKLEAMASWCLGYRPKF